MDELRDRWIGLVCLTLALSAIACAVGCATQSKSKPPQAQSAPAPPAPAEELSPFFMRQTIYAQSRGHDKQIDAVVQYVDGVVTTVFLNPLGKAGVILEQRGNEVKISGPAVDRVPFDLRWVAHDIGLALLVTPLRIDGRAGEARRELDSGPVVEQWDQGRLVRREAKALETVIQYEWTSGEACPETIRIENGEFGYHLRIETTKCRTE